MYGCDECPQCLSPSVERRFLFPRENFEDMRCTCTECDHQWDYIVSKPKADSKVSYDFVYALTK